MSETISSIVSVLGTSSPTLRPRRMTTARSATSMTWSIACETTITAFFSCRRRRMRSRTRRDSRTPEAAVGSSRTTTRRRESSGAAHRDRLTLSAGKQADGSAVVDERDLEAVERLAGRGRHFSPLDEPDGARQPSWAGLLPPGVEVVARA